MDLSRIDTVDFLTALNIRNIREQDDEVIFSCPFPNHRNNDEHPSASMNKHTNVYYCFGCEKSGNAISFLADLEGIAEVLAQKHIADRYGDTDYSGFMLAEHFNQIFNQKGRLQVKEKDRVLSWLLVEEREAELKKNPDAYEYLKNRGFTDKTLKHFHIGYDTISDMVCIPVIDLNGDLLGFKARAYSEDFTGPKYFVLGDRNHKDTKYGFGTCDVHNHIFNLRTYSPEDLIIVEGEFDAMSLWQKGITNAVSLYGSTFSSVQRDKILKFSRSLTLFLDSDKAGKKGARDIIKQLGMYSIIKVVPDHEGDPAELTKEECETLIQNATTPLQDYIMSMKGNK